jgi:hypothetical protein
MRLVKAALIFVLLGSAGAFAAESELKEVPARQSSRDVKLPSALVARIERDYRTFLKEQKTGEGEAIKRTLLNVSVELTQEKPVALHESVRILTPLGGGVIDLEDFVTPLRGEYHARINATLEKGEAPDDLRVFFVSHAKSRRIDGENYGAGCNLFMEITSFFKKKMKSSGFELYTADQRDLAVLGGTFVLASFDKEALHVGGVTFTDSRHPDEMCE